MSSRRSRSQSPNINSLNSHKRRRSRSSSRRNSISKKHLKSGTKMFSIKNINSKLTDSALEDSLLRDYSPYGDVSVKICVEGDLRDAFISFKRSDDAKAAIFEKKKVNIGNRVYNLEAMDPPILRPNNHSPSKPINILAPQILEFQHILQEQSGSSKTPIFSPLDLVANLQDPLMNFSNSDIRLGLHSPRFNKPFRFSKDIQDASETNIFCNLVLDPKASRTLFVGSLEPDIQEHEILAFFSPFGHVEHIDIKRPITGHPSAYAFVRFENIDMTSRAKMQMNTQCVRSTHCKIGFGKPIPSRSVYVGGLCNLIPKNILFDLLTKFGSLNYFFYEVGQNFAIATYVCDEMATEAVKSLRGFIFEHVEKEIYLDFAGNDIPSLIMQSSSQIKDIILSNKVPHAIFSIREMAFFNPPLTISHYHRRRYPSVVSFNSREDSNLTRLAQAVSLNDLKLAIEPSLGGSVLLMKNSIYPFEGFHVCGDLQLSEKLLSLANSKNIGLLIKKRIKIGPTWMSEAVELTKRSLEDSQLDLAILLAVPRHTGYVNLAEEKNRLEPKIGTLENVRPLSCLLAYLRLKQSICILESLELDINSKLNVFVYPSSSFSLCLLKLAAPKLACELAASNNYFTIQICKIKT